MNQNNAVPNTSGITTLIRCLLIISGVLAAIDVYTLAERVYYGSIHSYDLALVCKIVMVVITVCLMIKRSGKPMTLNRNVIVALLAAFSISKLIYLIDCEAFIYYVEFYEVIGLCLALGTAAMAVGFIMIHKGTKPVLIATGLMIACTILQCMYSFWILVQCFGYYMYDSAYFAIIMDVLNIIQNLALPCFFTAIFLLVYKMPGAVKAKLPISALPPDQVALLKTKLEIGAITEEQYRQQLEQLRTK